MNKTHFLSYLLLSQKWCSQENWGSIGRNAWWNVYQGSKEKNGFSIVIISNWNFILFYFLKEAEAKNIQEFVINGAKDAGEKAAEESFKEGLEQVAEEAFLPHILKMCEEEGHKKGEEVFGEFGAQIGKEAAVYAGRKAGLAKAFELLMEGGFEFAKTSGGEAGTIDYWNEIIYEY